MNYNLMYILEGVVIAILIVLKGILNKFESDLVKEEEKYE